MVKGVSGPVRAMAYRVALGTGFRADELRSLTTTSFHLDADPPKIVCEAAYTKNGRLAEQPVAESLASLLRPWLASRAPDRPVFNLPPKTAEMLRADLAAAKIPYETPSGVCDFHSLRGVYISNLVASGDSVKTCQVLARHSTPSLTIGVYAKASLHDVKGAVESLPDLTATAPRTEAAALAPTGTDPAANATQNATLLPEFETQPQAGQLLAIGSTEDLGSYTERCEGSSPSSRIRIPLGVPGAIAAKDRIAVRGLARSVASELDQGWSAPLAGLELSGTVVARAAAADRQGVAVEPVDPVER